MPEYVDYTTVAHLGVVELISVGMEWPASTGPYTCTFEQIADIIVAANDDPLVQDPRIKLGHQSEVNGEMRTVNPFAAVSDAAPAFGRIVNLRAVNDGAVLVGDFVEVPKWLAESMPSAYPSRSAEPWLDAQTPGGKRYAAVLTAVSLLGTHLPAVGDLQDLQRFIEGGPAALEGSVPELSVSVGVIRDRFNFEWALDEASLFEGPDGNPVDPYWWWARDVRVDPSEVIADDDEGNLWSVPFTTDGADQINFGTPERVREVYVPVSASQDDPLHRTAVPRAGQRVLAVNLARPEKEQRQGAASAAETATEEEATVPTTIERLRELGLPEDVTEDQISSALEQETPETPADPPPDEGDKPDEEPDEKPDEAPAAASLGVTVDRDAFAQLQSDAQAGREAREAQLASDRERLIETAVSKGKFPRSAAASYRSQLDKGGQIEAQTRQFIEGLPDGTIPVDELGTEQDGNDGMATTGWFPKLAQKGA